MIKATAYEKLTLLCNFCNEKVAECEICGEEFKRDEEIYCDGSSSNYHLCLTCINEMRRGV